ncbi:MAG TPA: PilN domain-containing protein [Acidobacteriota bacterium]|nr:PilN domain-containing protein [Acidobacteriota bacterium]
MSMITVNLLPPELRRSAGGVRFSKSILIGTLATVAFVGVLIGATAIQSMRLVGVQDEIARAQAQVERLQDDIRLVDRLEDVKTKILRRMSAIESLDRDRGFWVNNVEDVLAVIPDYLWLSSVQRQVQKKSAAGAAPDTTQSAPTYVFDGFCFTISSLANLILNMQDSPRFSHISLHHTALEEMEARRVYGFQVTCQLEPVSAETSGFGDDPEAPPELGWDQTDLDGALAAENDWNVPVPPTDEGE